MDQLKQALDFLSESRMIYGHLTIILLYGLLGVFVVGPFLGLIFFPPQEPLDVANVGPFYWQRMATMNVTGVFLYVVVAFNVGLLLSSIQNLTNAVYWRLIITPIAQLLGRGGACIIIERDVITSTKHPGGEYARFLEWLEPQKHRRRVRGWDWFISNAFRTLGFLLFLFLMMNLLLVLLAVLGANTEPSFPLTLSARSWVMVAANVIVFVLTVPGDIHHYRARAEGDAILFSEFQRSEDVAAQDR